MISVKELRESFLHLFFPHICSGCGNDQLALRDQLCLRCIASLPETGFAPHPDNPVEKKFYGRIALREATAQYYFGSDSMMQQLIHQLKYQGNQELGKELGRFMGKSLLDSGRFNADGLVPLPLFPLRQRRRGYNQSAVLCEGMAEMMHIPVLDKIVIRTTHTGSQTQHGRIERWNNMKGRFRLVDPVAATDKYLLLVDDVITTGATMEACGEELLTAPGLQLGIVGLCVAN